MTVRTLVGQQATELVIDTFRAHGLLLEAGELLAAGVGLTAARWQVLGAIELAGRPLTVPQIARRMGLTRQTVHVTVKRLTAARLVELAPNADHLRSQVVRLTALGQTKYRAIDRKQISWINRLAAGIKQSDLVRARQVLAELSGRLEAELAEDRQS